MNFDVYYPFTTKQGLRRPGVKPHSLDWSEIKKMCAAKANTDLIDRFRNGDKDAKSQLPAICFVGECMKTRANKYMRPTQAVMIDLDHVENAKLSYESIRDYVYERMGKDWWYDNVLLWHITPSGHGLRGVIWAQADAPDYEGMDAHNLPCQMHYLNDIFRLKEHGDFDEPCKDFARISFFFKPEELLFENAQLLTVLSNKKPEGLIINYNIERGEQPLFENEQNEEGKEQGHSAPVSKHVNEESDVPQYTEQEMLEIQSYDYDGTPLARIIEKYVEVKGQPGKMKIHNYYNDMVKNFRHIMNNDKRVIFALLPRFGHTAEECWSQIVSICRVNTMSNLPKQFYFFLKDNGFYRGSNTSAPIADFLLAEKPANEDEKLPWMPPVFREIIATAPKDFKFPMMVSLLPIMGTLSSYVCAPYYYDFKVNTPSFFSIIYAPAGTGKGFVGRYMDFLFEKLRTRDFIQQAREQLYLNEIGRKSANDKAPEEPHTSLRIIEPKNSEAEFLSKQKDNHGYHMFTYAAEMDSWAKGVKAAGGNKDDMLRIAWDNDTYGQHFKSANTVKGSVKLYWNVLITGTLPQVLSYFKNVENGLVTRCSFCSIDNQEFVDAPVWKHLTPKQKEVVRRYMERCDANTYEQPCELLPEDISLIRDPKKFDDEVDWHFTFKPRKTVDMEWLRKTIQQWLRDELKKSAKEYDKARDVFRRRVAVRGFRLGLICTTLWDAPKKSDLAKCCEFIKWFMDNDLKNILQLWGDAYNQVAQDVVKIPQKNLYQVLPSEFTTNDVMAKCMQLGIQTPVRNITSKWCKFGFITKVSKNNFKKKGNEKGNTEQSVNVG